MHVDMKDDVDEHGSDMWNIELGLDRESFAVKGNGGSKKDNFVWKTKCL